MMRSIAKRLVDVPVNVGMQGDHLADGHSGLLVIGSVAKQSGVRSFSVDCLVGTLIAMTKFVETRGTEG
jgi:hypothetical protein